MTGLSQIFIDEIMSVCDKDERIIACGINPDDSSLCFITGGLDVRSIVPNGELTPVKLNLEFDGRHLHIEFAGRTDSHRVNSVSLIHMSKSCLNISEMSIRNLRIGTLTLSDV